MKSSGGGGGEKFDPEALEPEAGIRALWLLYKRGQWGALSDFGLDRAFAEEAFQRFDADEIVNNRLTKAQCSRLVRLVPGLEEASTELRLAYALKFYEQGAKGSEVFSRRSGGG